eukprot:TRINITY_DN2956_c0_g2_i1.p1 TRINITY_DN2956_c0_g2~~TRINITY_DN2956_c0_g2_i1.p1  ORF type:complete len:757 (+),score=161.94 TRINITY_DN2956_c0_g2_i1:245-2272(+)
MGITFTPACQVEVVTPGKQAAAAGFRKLLGWQLTAIDSETVRSTEDITRIIPKKKSLTKLSFQMITEEVVIRREYREQALGISLSPDLIINWVTEASPADLADLPKFIGWKMIAVDGREITAEEDLINRSMSKREFSVSVVKLFCRMKLHIKRREGDKLGVTFSENLSIESVAKGSVGERMGFRPYIGGVWRVFSVDGKCVSTTTELAAALGKKLQVLFVLAPVSLGNMSSANNNVNSRRITVIRKSKNESLGLCCDDLVISEVKTGSCCHKAGLQGLLGWRLQSVDGEAVDPDSLKTAVGDKLKFVLEVILDNKNLPSSIIKVEMTENKQQRDLLNAFGRYGTVMNVQATEEVKTVPCPTCHEELPIEALFCTSCGGKATRNVSPFYAMVTFLRVEDAKAALQDPPTTPGVRSLKYYHPPRQQEVHIEEETEDAKPKALSLATCLGFFNAYSILDVPRDATPEEIKAAYKIMSMRYHPDKTRHITDPVEIKNSADMFKACAKAKRMLTDKDEKLILQQEIEKSIAIHGSKAVLARIPTRGKKKQVEEKTEQEVQLNNSVYGRHYHTGKSQPSRNQPVRSGKSQPANLRGYKGLQSFKILPKEVPAATENWEEEKTFSREKEKRQREHGEVGGQQAQKSKRKPIIHDDDLDDDDDDCGDGFYYEEYDDDDYHGRK